MPIEDDVRDLAREYGKQLKSQIDKRVSEMDEDNTSHFLIYQVLGVSDQEGRLIDIYQNKGRFLYKYAGSFLETAAKKCFQYKFGDARTMKVPNTRGQRPRTFEIDCVFGTDALEIKWRDATTDGDHIIKEHTRVAAVVDAGFRPIRVMFYYPNRSQAIKIQQAIETLYRGVGGAYYYGDSAWDYVYEQTTIDLLSIMQKLAKENAQSD